MSLRGPKSESKAGTLGFILFVYSPFYTVSIHIIYFKSLPVDLFLNVPCYDALSKRYPRRDHICWYTSFYFTVFSKHDTILSMKCNEVGQYQLSQYIASLFSPIPVIPTVTCFPRSSSSNDLTSGPRLLVSTIPPQMFDIQYFSSDR